MAVHALTLLSPLILLSLSLSTLSLSPPTTDTAALLLFRSQTDTHGILLSNWTLPTTTTTSACSAGWQGVHCSNGRVTALSLPSLDLRGPIDSLSSLDELRLLDLHGNRLNGTLSPVTNCTNLKLIYLSGNDFSGEIPATISSLTRLLRLDLSNNNLKGPIPNSIANLTRLLTLRLQNNEISGQIPQFLDSIPSLNQLNLSNNELYGRLPENLRTKFGDRSFSGNYGLCGPNPLPVCSFTGNPPSAASAQIVPSNPSSLPSTTNTSNKNNSPNRRKGLSPGAIVAIVIANSVVLLIITSFVVAYYCGNGRESRNSIEGSESGKSRKIYANNGGGGDSDGTNATDRSKLVFFDKKKRFELEDLLRASAEMLGKGSIGTVYKAVLDDGFVAAVKRLKDTNPCGRREFEQYMDVIGKLKHPNIVRLRAYYYAKEEKLLVYDYLPNGSLHSLLHGMDNFLMSPPNV